jgi:hypothetical protein
MGPLYLADHRGTWRDGFGGRQNSERINYTRECLGEERQIITFRMGLGALKASFVAQIRCFGVKLMLHGAMS